MRLPLVLVVASALGAALCGCELLGNIGDVTLAVDGGGDAGVADGASGDDAAKDGGASSDGGSFVDCKNALFCADFDESDDPKVGFNQVAIFPNASMAVDSTHVHSGIHSFASGLAPGTVYTASALGNSWSMPLTSASLDYYLMLDAVDVSTDTLCIFAIGTGGVQSQDASVVRGYVKDGAVQLVEEYTNASGRQKAPLEQPFVWPLQKWLHVAATLDLASHIATLAVDGAPTVTTQLQGTWTASDVFFWVGIFYSQGLSGQRLYVDDVRFNAPKP